MSHVIAYCKVGNFTLVAESLYAVECLWLDVLCLCRGVCVSVSTQWYVCMFVAGCLCVCVWVFVSLWQGVCVFVAGCLCVCV